MAIFMGILVGKMMITGKMMMIIIFIPPNGYFNGEHDDNPMDLEVHMKDTILRQAREFVDHVLETNGGVFGIHINFCNIHVKLKSGYQQKCWVSSKNKRISTRTTGRDMQYPAACRGVKGFFYFPSNC